VHAYVYVYAHHTHILSHTQDGHDHTDLIPAGEIKMFYPTHNTHNTHDTVLSHVPARNPTSPSHTEKNTLHSQPADVDDSGVDTDYHITLSVDRYGVVCMYECVCLSL
jgi:hypothetical protein